MAKRGREGEELMLALAGAVRKRRRGDAKHLRFDKNVHTLWETLDELGPRHVVFTTDGVVDLMVAYGRPLLPMYARVPAVVGGQCNVGNAIEPRGEFADPASLASLVPVGATISCFNPLNHHRHVDAIVVVPPDPRMGIKCGKREFRLDPRHMANAELWVGVIVPVVRVISDAEYDFGADRTLFFETLGETNAGAPTLDWPIDDAYVEPWVVPPAEGLYAVHYINIWSARAGFLNRATGKYSLERPFLANSSVCSLPNASTSNIPSHPALHHQLYHRVHMLHNEIEHEDMERRLLAGIHAERLRAIWSNTTNPSSTSCL